MLNCEVSGQSKCSNPYPRPLELQVAESDGGEKPAFSKLENPFRPQVEEKSKSSKVDDDGKGVPDAADAGAGAMKTEEVPFKMREEEGDAALGMSVLLRNRLFLELV